MSGKLQQLCEIEGKTDMELFEEGTFDSVCQGICMNDGCDYTTEVEPDCREGWCEVCDTQSVTSALILGDMI